MMSILQSDIPAGKISFNALLAISLGIHITILGGALLFRSSNTPLPHLQSITVEIKSMDSPDEKVEPNVKKLPTAIPVTVQKKSVVAASSIPAMPVQQTEALPLAKREEMLLPSQTKTIMAVPELATVGQQPAKVQPKASFAAQSVASAGKASPVAAQPNAISREYTSRIRALIDQQKEYPLMARRSGTEGTVYIKFFLARDGKLKRAEVSRSSGRSILDKAAINAVTSVNRFPAVPEAMEGSELSFELPLAFKIAGN